MEFPGGNVNVRLISLSSVLVQHVDFLGLRLPGCEGKGMRSKEKWWSAS